VVAVQQLTALADPTRRQIVELLANGDESVNSIVEHFDVSQPAISRHLKILRACGLVRVRHDGQRRIYSLDPEPLADLDDWLSQYRTLWTRRLDALEVEVRRGRSASPPARALARTRDKE
jgi:DNA-binding transcriptional ArsR family regulator